MEELNKDAKEKISDDPKDFIFLAKYIYEGNLQKLKEWGPQTITAILLNCFDLSTYDLEITSGKRDLKNEMPLVRNFRDHLEMTQDTTMELGAKSFKYILSILFDCGFSIDEISTALDDNDFGLDPIAKEEFNNAARELDIAPIFSESSLLRGVNKKGHTTSQSPYGFPTWGRED